jgi:tetratricopeptide (TPR) repeat protein
MSMATGPSTPPADEGSDRREVIKALEARLASTPKAIRPLEHATLAYRLGLAYAEAPVAGQVESLRKAVGYYEVAANLFDPVRRPLEHARVLNAGGAAYRALGDRQRAATLFQEAARMMEGRGRDNERAATLNNLGLVRSELGDLAAAVEACDAGVELWDTTAAEGRRGMVATLHTRGMARAAGADEEGLEAAIGDYERALAEIDPGEAPYHFALVHHSMGVAQSSLATLRPQHRVRLLHQAIESFTESLTIFSRAAFPFQYALAKHNQGLAFAALGGEDDRRRALACFEDAVAVLDPRIHAEPWRQAYASLSKVEEELEAATPGTTRTDQFVALVAGADREERVVLLRERLTRLLAQQEPQRRASLTELALASARLGYDDARTVMEAELSVLMELPTESLQAALRARVGAHARLSGDAREEADSALEQAVSDALQGPQRISVRDFLYSLGYERP